MFDTIMVFAILGIGCVGGYLIGRTEGKDPIDRGMNFFGLRRPPST